MNMMDGIAATASSLASAQLQQSYTLAVSKRQWSPRSWQYRSCCKCSSSSGYQFDVYA